MNTSAVVPRLDLVNGRPVATSLNVAEVFGKQHQHVIRAIKNLTNDIDAPNFGEPDFSRSNFGPSSYVDERGKAQPMYQITRDGFTLLAMGFTGKAAMQFKLAYIDAFNRMEQELLSRSATGGKRSRADIHHHRGPVSPNGLDIRYTLDLTKILLRPTRTTLSLLERLTGVDVSDLAEQAVHIRPGHEAASSIQGFLRDCTTAAPGGCTSYPLLYSRYVVWCTDRQLLPGQIASNRLLAAALRDLEFTVEKRGGKLIVHGLAVSQEVAA